MNQQKILETHAREIQRRREVAQTTLRQLADGKVILNTVALFQTSCCTGYSATADLHSLSLNLMHPYIYCSMFMRNV